MPIAIDFGTCNTVIARWNETLGAVDFIQLDTMSRKFAYQLPGEKAQKEAWVIPSLIHYGEGESYHIGEQVSAAGLTNEPGTFRRLKKEMLHPYSASRRVNGRMVSYTEAATDLLKRMLVFAKGIIGGEDEDLIVTVPVEAFDHYVEWLRGTAAAIFSRDVRVIDEATACIFGYCEQVKDGEIDAVFDFGGGTLDVAIVKTEITADGKPRCRLLGRAGEDIGGALVDDWLLEELQRTQGLSKQEIADIGIPLLGDIERAKIELSSGAMIADITRLNDISRRLVSHNFHQTDLARVLKERGLHKSVARTVERAVEAAHDKVGIKKSQISGVFMVGGSSLLLGVVEKVEDLFPDSEVHCKAPFEAIAAGACRFMGEDDLIPILVHDYCIQGWNRQTKEFDLIPVVPKGTQYPTEKTVLTKYLNGASDGAVDLGMLIYERAFITGHGSRVAVDSSGRVRILDKEENTFSSVRLLNPNDKQFVSVDPPCRLEEKKRFIIGFGVDRQKRLTIDLEDTKEGNRSHITTRSGENWPLPVRNFPIVKL